MTLQDVKSWDCKAKVAVAVNPYIYTEKDFYIRKSDGESWGDFYAKKSIEFNNWTSDPANQLSTELTGVYRADEVEVKEVWEFHYNQCSQPFRPVPESVYKNFENYDSYAKFCSVINGTTRLRYTLIKKEGRKEIKPDLLYELIKFADIIKNMSPDAGENKKTVEENRSKLDDAISQMLEANGGELKRVTYYHSTATFIETKYGKFMLRLTSYDPPKVGLDEFEKPKS